MVWHARILLAATLAVPAAPLLAAPPVAPSSAKPRPEWVVRSDEHARVSLGVLGRFSPEFAGFLGVEGLDREILDLKPNLDERSDEILGQGLLPPDVLGRAVKAEFVPAERARGTD
jgi:hypothetical protein